MDGQSDRSAFGRRALQTIGGLRLKIMVAPNARGGMRSVVEAYVRDGFIAREGVEIVHTYEEGGFLKRQLVLIRAFLRYALLLAARRVELVHIHAAMWGSFWRKALFSALARRFGVPVILHLHGSEMKKFYERQKPFARKLLCRQLELATRVVVLSESWRAFIAGIAPAARIEVVPNYVIVPAVISDDGRDGAAALFLGLIGPRKGVFDLIDAFAAVRDAFPAAKLVIGGNGQIEQARAQIDGLKLADAVDLAGWVGGADKERLLSACSIYVLPSYNEGLPMSVLEAMAAGLATVTTRVGGIPELITDGVDGLLMEPGDKETLAAHLKRLIGDDAFRAEIAAAGRKRVADHYSEQAVLPMLHRIYAECRRV